MRNWKEKKQNSTDTVMIYWKHTKYKGKNFNHFFFSNISLLHHRICSAVRLDLVKMQNIFNPWDWDYLSTLLNSVLPLQKCCKSNFLLGCASRGLPSKMNIFILYISVKNVKPPRLSYQVNSQAGKQASLKQWQASNCKNWIIFNSELVSKLLPLN